MNSSARLSLENIVKYLPHLPSPKQRRALEYLCPELLYGGAAGGGKSDFLLMGALQGIQTPGFSAILFRRTHTDLSLPAALMDRSHQWWSGTDAHWDGLKKVWRFPTGARISFGYLDGPHDHLRYQSAEFQFVGFDECSQFEEKQALYLLSRLRAPLGWPEDVGCRWRAATNPGGIGHQWLQERYRVPTEGTTKVIELRTNGVIQRVYVPALATDNPGLNVKDYLKNLSKLDPVTRAQLIEGKWIIDSSGLVYYCYSPSTSTCDVDCLPRIIPSKEWKYVLGTDYASTTDKTAFAVCAYTEHEPEVYLVWTEEHARMSPSEAAKRTEELGEQFGGFVSMVGDSGGLGAAYVLEMQKHWAIPIQPAEKQHKLAYVRLFNGELANGRLKIVAPHCQTWVGQAQVLLWADSTRTKEKQSQHNDSVDAALYAWRECRHYSTSERVETYEIDDEYEKAAVERAAARDWGGSVSDPWAGHW